MDEEPSDQWTGVVYAVIGSVALALALTDDSLAVEVAVPGVALVGIGAATALAPRLSSALPEVGDRLAGLGWALCGLAVLGIGLLSAPTPGKLGWGVVLGAGFVVYGVVRAARG
jgi:hypothetical protein